jgi:4-amino-4-deoxy-L-arabinose transferase-like glycosyltransferase
LLAQEPERISLIIKRLKNQGWEIWALALIILSGALLRVWLEWLWRPGFLGFPDTSAYFASTITTFVDVARPPGYPLFLDLLWGVWRDFEFGIVVQHLLGILTAILAYLLARALGAPRWASLIPAAVVSLGGAQILLEHAYLSEAPFTFFLVAAYTAVAFGADMHGPRDRRRYALLALGGLLLGVAALMRTYGVLLLVPLMPFVMLADRRPRPAVTAGAALVAPCLLVVLAVMGWHQAVTGHFALVETQFLNYYGRVATFADCDKFTPPKGSEVLCPTIPVNERQGQRYWDFHPESPVNRHFETGFGAHPTAEFRKAVRGFALAAVLNQPGDYVEKIMRETWRIFNPGFPLNPNPAVGNSEAGSGPVQMRETLVLKEWSDRALVTIAGTDSSLYGSYRSLDSFYAYESVARVSDLRIAILLFFALLAPLLSPAGAVRRGALMLVGSILLLVFFPILVNMYNYRYLVPVLPLIAVAAALGITSVGRRGRSAPAVSRGAPACAGSSRGSPL